MAFWEAGMSGWITFPVAFSRLEWEEDLRNVTDKNCTKNQIMMQDCQTGCSL